MRLLDSFESEKNKIATFYSLGTTRGADGHITKDYDTEKGSVKGFQFQTSASNRVINDKYREDIDSIFIVDPLDLIFSVDDKDKVKIGSDYYEVLYSENIGNLGEVYQIGLKKFDG